MPPRNCSRTLPCTRFCASRIAFSFAISSAQTAAPCRVIATSSASYGSLSSKISDRNPRPILPATIGATSRRSPRVGRGMATGSGLACATSTRSRNRAGSGLASYSASSITGQSGVSVSGPARANGRRRLSCTTTVLPVMFASTSASASRPRFSVESCNNCSRISRPRSSAETGVPIRTWAVWFSTSRNDAVSGRRSSGVPSSSAVSRAGRPISPNTPIALTSISARSRIRLTSVSLSLNRCMASSESSAISPPCRSGKAGGRVFKTCTHVTRRLAPSWPATNVVPTGSARRSR